MIREITAKTLLATVKQPDTWFGLKYNLNLYRGCQHQCIYCDSRSECYQIENFADILVKANALELLENELRRKRVKGTIGTGSMNDPYMPVEATRNLTGRALEVIARQAFPVHILTKGTLVLRDLPTLKEISRTYAAVSFTITTASDELGKQLEPGAPKVSERFAALEKLSSAGVLTGVTLMPVLPFLTDDESNLREIVARAAGSGAKYILAGFGVTLRDRQREYFYRKLDENFPGLKEKYQCAFGDRYSAPAQNARRLEMLFKELCATYQIARRMPFYEFLGPPANQNYSETQEEKIMESAIQDLVKMRDVESLSEVMTENEDWMICLDAAEGLIMLGDERGIEFLQDAAESEDEEISSVAKEILDFPEVRRMKEEIAARERQARQATFEIAKKRLEQGKKVFRYKTVYLPASYFTGEELDEDGENLPALDDFGLQGWEVAAFFPLNSNVASVTLSGKPTGGYFLLQKEITPDESAELDEL